MATDHGIARATCLTCGYSTTDPDALEAWNHYGDACPRQGCDPNRGRTEWVMADGRREVITQPDDPAEYTDAPTRYRIIREDQGDEWPWHLDGIDGSRCTADVRVFTT